MHKVYYKNMNLWYFLLLLYPVISNRLVRTLRLNNYISDYRLTKLRITHDTEPDDPSNVMTKTHAKMSQPPTIRLNFSAYDEEFDFTLTKEENYEPMMLKSIGYVNSTIRNWKPKFYQKFSDRGQPMTAFGYLHDDTFVGCLTVGNVTYFFEPPTWYFPKDKKYTTLIYRSMDVISPINQVLGAGKSIPPRRPFKHPGDYSLYDELVCKIEIVGDFTLSNLVKSGSEMTASFLYYHVKFADFVFRTTNFGVPPIRISAEHTIIHITPFGKKTRDFYPPITAKEFLYHFSQRKQDACLSFCICDRNFADDLIGVSFKASENNSFGICQTKTINVANKSIHTNTGIMTMRLRNNHRLPLSVSTEIFTHQLGHLFGSDHDPPNNSDCAFDEDYGYYIMKEINEEAPGKITHVPGSFSPCSIANMSLTIQERIDCLNTTFMFCGNGVREGIEMCDCGQAERECKILDECCTPSGDHGIDTECTFRRSAGSVCSPLENACCDNNCHLANQSLCYYDDERCLISLCDGVSRECPDPSPSADGTPCKLYSRICINGKCNTTICRHQKLSDCICEEEKHSCQICCKSPYTGECVPAWMLGFYTPDGTEYMRIPYPFCRSVNKESKNHESGQWNSTKQSKSDEMNNNWIISIAIAVAVISILIVISGIIIFLYMNRSPVVPASSTVPPGNSTAS